jgi:hypothetical protein
MSSIAHEPLIIAGYITSEKKDKLLGTLFRLEKHVTVVVVYDKQGNLNNFEEYISK